MSYTVRNTQGTKRNSVTFPDFEDALTVATESDFDGDVWAVVDNDTGEIDALVYKDTVYVRAE